MQQVWQHLGYPGKFVLNDILSYRDVPGSKEAKKSILPCRHVDRGHPAWSTGKWCQCKGLNHSVS